MATDWSNPSSSFDAMWAAMGFGPQVGAPQGYVSPNALMSNPISNPAVRTGGVDSAVGGGLFVNHGDPGPGMSGGGRVSVTNIGAATHDQRLADYIARMTGSGGLQNGAGLVGGSNLTGDMSAPVDPSVSMSGAGAGGADSGGMGAFLQMLLAALAGKGGGAPVSGLGGGGAVTMPMPMDQPAAMPMNPGGFDPSIQQMALARMFAS